MTAAAESVAAFIEAALVPRDAGHRSGTLDRAEEILAAHPEVAHSNIYTAAILGDDSSVRRFLEADPRSAYGKGGPRDWDALTHLCFSRYLRLDRSRSDGFVRAATALVDAGASANTGWFETTHEPRPVWESALYGAAGVAQHPELTGLLLERGADPNDDETSYHAPETFDNTTLKILVESGKLNETSLATILLRKADWHDADAIAWLLEHGAEPNRKTHWGGKTALHQAVLRDNAVAIVEVLLDHGADPMLLSDHGSAVVMAARRGRGDVLELLERRGFSVALAGVDRLVAACARNDREAVRSTVAHEPALGGELVANGGALLARFAGNGNVAGVRHLLDLGVDVNATFTDGDGYFGIAKDSTALHVAAWLARHATVKLLIDHGANVHAQDGRGRTALALAVRAAVDSYWTHRRSADSVEALLRAGASPKDIPFPSGYAEVDEVLRRASQKSGPA